jgi:uncharacterized membrane protein YkvI
MGIVVTTLLFILYGYIIMDMGMTLKSTSHLSIIRNIGGKWIGILADILITFFLFGAFTAMIAGSGALFRQEFNISFLAGNAVMAVITIITVLTGFKGIINAISFVVPFLIVAAVGGQHLLHNRAASCSRKCSSSSEAGRLFKKLALVGHSLYVIQYGDLHRYPWAPGC